MSSPCCTTSHARRFGVAVGVAVAAGAAAAIVGMTGAPAAHADDASLPTDIGLLNSAETDVIDAFNLWSQAGHPPPADLPGNLIDITDKFEAIQTPLLSSDNSFLSGLGDVLFNGPDQQLAQSSDAFLVAAEALAADPTSGINELDALSTTLQYGDALLFGALPADVVGGIIDRVLGFDIAATTGADLATGFGLPF